MSENRENPFSGPAFVTPADWGNRGARVLVVGAGGTGSRLLVLLADMDVALRRLGHAGLRVTVVDPDTVSEANVGRSAFLPCDVGLPKAEALVTRLCASRGLSGWTAQVGTWECEDVPLSFVSGVVVSCVDRVEPRLRFAQSGAQRDASEVLWIDCGNMDRYGQVIAGHWAARVARRLPNVVDLFSGALRATRDEDAPSCSFAEAVSRQDITVNMAMAQAAAELLWAVFRHGGLWRTHGAFVDLRDPCGWTPLPVDPTVWARMGYRPGEDEGKEEHQETLIAA